MFIDAKIRKVRLTQQNGLPVFVNLFHIVTYYDEEDGDGDGTHGRVNCVNNGYLVRESAERIDRLIDAAQAA